MKECFVISGPTSCGNRILAAILISAGCTGDASTLEHEWYPENEERAVIIRHWLSGEVFALLQDRGYKVTVLMPVRDNQCAEASRQKKGYGANLAANPEAVYRHNFIVLPDDVPFQMVPYESLAYNGPGKLLESLGLPAAVPPFKIDHHECNRVIDANAKYYGRPKAEDEVFENGSLVWLPEEGVGFFPVKGPGPYDQAYFDKYVEYANTERGEAITKARIGFVNRYFTGEVVDIGIGCGDFVASRPNTYGYDINPKAEKWLATKGKFFDPNFNQYRAATFWDSLEHINNPGQILQYASDYVFVSIPIFEDCYHVTRSRHYRKDEHFWYFTKEGFVNWMAGKGFDLLEVDDFETRLGREDILSFAFKRKNTGGINHGKH